MLQKIQTENFNRIIRDQEKHDFNINADGVYLILFSARCKNWLQNFRRLFNDDDLALQIDDYLFAEIGGKKREFSSAGSWNGNELKNEIKDIFIILPLKKGVHTIKFWVGEQPFLEKIEIYKIDITGSKEINLLRSDIEKFNGFMDVIIKNLAVSDLTVKAKAEKDDRLELKVDGKIQLNPKYKRYAKWFWYGQELQGALKEYRAPYHLGGGAHSLEFRGQGQPTIESVSFVIRNQSLKFKVGKVRLYEDIIISDLTNLRSSPRFKNNQILAQLKNGDVVEILEERVIGDYFLNYSEIWHEVIHEDKRGFILSSFVEIDGQERERTIDLIKEKCRQYGADANIMLAIAGVESHYKPYAMSATGCKGIFELSGSTADWIGGVSDRYDIYQNIDGGVRNYKAIEKKFAGRGNILEKRLVAWHDGINSIPVTGLIDYSKLKNPGETKSFVKNVLANIEKRNWFRIIWLPCILLVGVLSFWGGALHVDNELSASVLFGFDSLPISAEYFSKVGNNLENLNLKATGENIIFNEEYEGIKKIIVRDLRDKDMNPYAELIYWNSEGVFKEILSGYLSNAAWIYFQAGSHIFWIEREEGKYLPSSLYLPRDGRLVKIKFLDNDGRIWDERSGPFDILNLSGPPVFREYEHDTECFSDTKEYEFDFGDNLFKEIKSQIPVECPDPNNFQG